MNARKGNRGGARKRPVSHTTAVERAYGAWLGARSLAWMREGDGGTTQSERQLGVLLDRERAAWWALLKAKPESVLDVKRRVRALHLYFADMRERGTPTDNSHMLMLTAVLCDVECISTGELFQ